MSRLGGLSGNLFPGQYLAERLILDVETAPDTGEAERMRHALARWWRTVDATCGPATGMRELFDRVAMPLVATLGFEASVARFRTAECRSTLETPAGTPLVLMVRPWAERPRARWRDIAAAAREMGASWGFVLAPPFLSLVDLRGSATYRRLDVTLPAVIESSAFSAFAAICRAQAFDRASHSEQPPIESAVASAASFQARVRSDLQAGVAAAFDAMVSAIGTRPRPRGRASVPASEQALTLVYRVLFLLFAESRGLVPQSDSPTGRSYAMAHLCREASSTVPRFSLWDALAATTRLWRRGCREGDLIAAPFNGRLFARGAVPDLEGTRATRRASHLARHRDRLAGQALVALGSRAGRSGREPIGYQDLGVEQLGAVYERLLDLPLAENRPPESQPTSPRRRPAAGHSTARKRSGTFYTPQPLAEFVVRRTLAPLVTGASSEAILALRILDPAMGSGAFLVAACRYLADACADALVAEGQLGPDDLDEVEQTRLRRLVAERCLAGVDSNPVAVQLAKLSLWLATLARGKPLGFLDHRLRIGDSLIGAGPVDLAHMRRAGQGRRAQPLPLFDPVDIERAVRRQAPSLQALLATHDESVREVQTKERLWRRLTAASAPLAPWRDAATLWCARWFWSAEAAPVPSQAELRALMDGLLRSDRTLSPDRIAERCGHARTVGQVRRFFHWPLEFPDVFHADDGETAGRGFDAVIGNPPWEMLRRDPRDRSDDRRGTLRFVRESGLYPACDRGHLNLYQPFLERALSLARPGGRLGLVVPWGLAVDEGATALRRRLLDDTAVSTIVGLDNRAGLFPVHRGLRFAVVVATSGATTREIQGRFGLTRTEEIEALPEHEDADAPARERATIRLTQQQLKTVGGSTGRLPFARDRRDVAFLLHLARHAPRFGDDNSWKARFGRELNATESRADCGPRGLAVLDGRHVTRFCVNQRSTRGIERAAALRRLARAPFDAARLGYRDVSGASNTRSLIAAVIPPGVVTTHTLLCLKTPIVAEHQHYLCGLLNSFVLNAAVRLLMGSHVTTTLVEDLPVPPWHGDDRGRLIALLAEQLVAHPGDPGMTAVLEAHVAATYGIDPDMFDCLLDGFPLVDPQERAQAAAALRRITAARSTLRVATTRNGSV